MRLEATPFTSTLRRLSDFCILLPICYPPGPSISSFDGFSLTRKRSGKVNYAVSVYISPSFQLEVVHEFDSDMLRCTEPLAHPLDLNLSVPSFNQ